MKKLLISISALLLVFSVTACSNFASSNNSTQANSEASLLVDVSRSSATEEQTTAKEENSTEEVSIENITEDKTSTIASSPSATEATTKNIEVTTKKPVTTTQEATTKPATSQKLPSYTPDAEITALFNEINDYRAKNGLNKLILDPTLCKMAYVRADEQNTLKGHIRPDNTKYYSILDQYNYDYTGCGENIAFVGEISADRAFNLWKNSSTHNQNMLEPRWTKSGIAVHKYIDGTYSIVQIFVA